MRDIMDWDYLAQFARLRAEMDEPDKVAELTRAFLQQVLQVHPGGVNGEYIAHIGNAITAIERMSALFIEDAIEEDDGDGDIVVRQ